MCPYLFGLGFAVCSFLSHNQQSRVRNDIENQKNNFKQAEKRVNDNIVSFPGNCEPSALHAIHQIRCEHKEHCPQKEDAAIYDRAPHKEAC